jgi:cytochrome c-550 PedF
MAKNKLLGMAAIAAVTGVMLSGQAMAHGDVTPQGVDTASLTQVGEEWVEENPYRGHDNKDYAEAVRIGDSAYNQNCARCHGLEAISGGIAPDLRELATDIEGDEWYVYRVRNGAVRDGAVYMPKMADYLSQEALWAIRTYIESRRELMQQ